MVGLRPPQVEPDRRAADDAAELTTHLAGHLDALAGLRERSAS